MNKIFILIFTIFSVFGIAQTDINFNLNKFDRHIVSNFDIENNYYYLMRLNPSFVHMQNVHDSLKVRNNILTLDFVNKKTDGLYHFYDGNSSMRKKIFAGGEINVNKSTFFGLASYSILKKDNIKLNYVVNPKEYLPYLVGDKLCHGEVDFRDYDINVGFGTNYKNLYYGLDFYYKGVVSYRLENPRFSSYLGQLKINLGVLLETKNNIYSFRFFPELERQSISVINFERLAPTYYFFYGFGKWHQSESIGATSYRRQMSIKGASFDFSYATNLKSKLSFNYLFNLNYKFNKVSTLEKTNLNIFESNNKFLNYNFLLKKDYKRFNFHLLFNGENKIQRGIEYVYENKEFIDGFNLLQNDFKVGSNRMYKHISLFNSSTLKLIYRLSSTNNLHFLIGANSLITNESYFFPKRKILVNNLTPLLGFGYDKHLGGNNLFFNIKLSKQKNINRNFNLQNIDDQFFKLQAHMPYVIASSDNYSLSSDIIYSHNFSEIGKIGMKLAANYIHKNKFNGYPRIFNDKYDDLSTSLKLFYIF